MQKCKRACTRVSVYSYSATNQSTFDLYLVLTSSIAWRCILYRGWVSAPPRRAEGPRGGCRPHLRRRLAGEREDEPCINARTGFAMFAGSKSKSKLCPVSHSMPPSRVFCPDAPKCCAIDRCGTSNRIPSSPCLPALLKPKRHVAPREAHYRGRTVPVKRAAFNRAASMAYANSLGHLMNACLGHISYFVGRNSSSICQSSPAALPAPKHLAACCRHGMQRARQRQRASANI